VNPLDREIVDSFALLGVLLVFVLAFASAITPLIASMLERPAPDVEDDRRIFIGHLRAYRLLALSLAFSAAAVLAILYPLSRRVIAAWTFSAPFHTSRAGLLLLDLFLLLTLIAATIGAGRLAKRIRQLS